MKNTDIPGYWGNIQSSRINRENNNIEHLDVSKNIYLAHLSCGGNHISDLISFKK